MFSADAIGTIGALARQHAFEPAAILAVAQVESGGRTHATVEGRVEPLIRFEGHYFDRRLAGEKQALARRAGLSATQAGTIANPRGQAERWAMLARAAAIDRKAAYESASWGIGQVMGAHWSWLGFSSVDALVAEARGGLSGQVMLMVRYIDKSGLRDALARHDWQAFARGYNGPGFAKNRYDTKLARAYRSYAAGEAGSGDGPIMLGARGARVADLQTLLSAQGYHLAADGVFGPLTRRALTRFQKDHQLVVDGVAGPQTMAALQRSLPIGAMLRRLWRSATRFFSGFF
ncbi:N-acetylmuramidase domain-containing protein [Nitratireductor soli]|uniref:N-acetylmuramidase domain-containing protein n=1 Tax=Nitratireductor soli TaxID=1670619 RepID=UPI00065E4126|nr:N-acetylmuramidase domain-containing protein [Nitratireductor soli]